MTQEPVALHIPSNITTLYPYQADLCQCSKCRSDQIKNIMEVRGIGVLSKRTVDNIGRAGIGDSNSERRSRAW